jgi:hypothetical protein
VYEDRIKLALAMGWEIIEGYAVPYGIAPSEATERELPDPFTDANDCEALIEHLNGEGWQVEIHWQHTSDENLAAGAWVHIWQHGTEIHHRTDIDVDRWKEAVSRIAVAIFEPTGEETGRRHD